MDFLDKLNFRKKLFMLLFLPALALLFYSLDMVSTYYQDYSKYKSIKGLSVLSVKISDLVHETQKERGLSAGYLGSEGKKFKVKLSLQRELTDKKRESLRSYIKKNGIRNYSTDFIQKLNDALHMLGKIDDKRVQISSLSYSTKEAVAYYTNANKKLLDSIATISNISDDAKINRNLNAYLSFLLAKERMGIERAVGTGALAKGSFVGNSKNYFIKLISEQGAYLDMFKYFAKKELLRKFNKLKKDKSILSVARMEGSMSKQDDLSLLNIMPKQWFETITEKINIYKELEDVYSADIIKTSDALYKDSFYKLVAFFILNTILFLAMGYFVLMISKRLTRKVEKFQEGLKKFLSYVAREEDHIDPLKVNGNDEFTNMTKMLNNQIEKISLIIEQDKKVTHEMNRVVNRVNNGFFNNVVNEKGASAEVEHLRVSINSMLKSSKEKFDTLIDLLNHFGEAKFDYEIPKDKMNGLNGEFGAVVTSAKLLGENMSELFAVIQNASGVLNTNTHRLSDSSNKLNNSTKEQEKSINNTLNALRVMKESSSQSIEDIRSSAAMAEKLSESSKKGLSLASKTANATSSINEKVDAISEAIEVIDDIAFQTNILSLNAAVEAATAGEVGKGFAVVAQEVRNLAAKSADAANEIKDLVEIAKEKSLEGKTISEKMIDGYHGLQDDIVKTKDMIEGVEKRGKILEDSMKKIDGAVEDMNKVIADNISIASNVTSLSDDIDNLSNDLYKIALHASYKDGVQEQVCDVDLNDTISKMKSKHLLFKTNILSKLDSKESFTVTPPTDCDLGKWMSAQVRNGEEFTKSRAWEKLIEDHKHIHATAQEFVDKNASDDSSAELDKVATKLENATITIFKALDEVKREHCQIQREKMVQKERVKVEV